MSDSEKGSMRAGEVAVEFRAWARATGADPGDSRVKAAYLAGRNAGVEASAKVCEDAATEAANREQERETHAERYADFAERVGLNNAADSIRALKTP